MAVVELDEIGPPALASAAATSCEWRAFPLADAARLVGVLGHELRNPLAAAMASVAAATAMTDEFDPRAALLARANTDLERLAKLLDSCLALARRQPPRRQPVDVIALAREIAQRRTGVTVEAATECIAITVDAALLRRAIENLVQNAQEAGASAVRVEIRRSPRAAIIDVADNGPGVPTDLLPRLFEPGVSGRGGTGLGLAVVADVARAHDGDIAVVASAHGARFRLVLPVV